MSLSDFDRKAIHDKSVLREVSNARTQIMERLSGTEYEDILEDELIILEAVYRTVHPQVIADAASDLGLTGRAIGQLSTRLMSQGFLARDDADDSGPGKITLTQRGIEVCLAIQAVIRSNRWRDFPLRSGDIVIATVGKSGSTWAQMICALLVFQTTDLPAPLQQLSLWMDHEDLSREDAFAQLAAQTHRRLIKTHLSLSEINFDPCATYVSVAREPLDIALSLFNIQNAVKAKSGHSPSPEMVLEWLDRETPFDVSLRGIMRQLSELWLHRNEPNVVLMHYEQLSEDLEGEMRRLAARLGIIVPETAWPSLVKAATFKEMRAAADRIQPVRTLTDPKAFFHSGTSGGGRALLTEAGLAHYHERLTQLASPDLVAWLHRERDSA